MSPVAATVERTPAFVGCVTLVAGTALVAAPGRVSGLLGLDGQERAVRAIGVSDLVLVPGLLRGRPRWPWMIARAALNVALAGYLYDVAPRSSSPVAVRSVAGLMTALTVVDGATGLALRRIS